jgi:hypothetical protein
MLRTTATRIVRWRATTAASTATKCIRNNNRPCSCSCSCSSVITPQLRLWSNEKDAISIAKSLVRSLSVSVSSAEDTDTTRPPPNSGFTWVQLYRGGQAVGSPMMIKDPAPIVGVLTDLVKEKLPNQLEGVDAARLDVYPPGTPLDALNDNARLRPRGPVPGGTTEEQPLLVMAPQLGKCSRVSVREFACLCPRFIQRTSCGSHLLLTARILYRTEYSGVPPHYFCPCREEDKSPISL